MRWWQKRKVKHIREERVKRERDIDETACGFVFRPGTPDYDECVRTGGGLKKPSDYRDPIIAQEIQARRSAQRQMEAKGGKSFADKNAEYDAWLEGPEAYKKYQEERKRFLAGY